MLRICNYNNQSDEGNTTTTANQMKATQQCADDNDTFCVCVTVSTLITQTDLTIIHSIQLAREAVYIVIPASSSLMRSR